MKLEHIVITNFLGLRRFDVQIRRPVLLVWGMHGVGKSSLNEAIRLAFMAESVRIAQKKDYAGYVTEGAKAAQIEITGDQIHASVGITSTGNVRDGSKDLVPPPALGYVLNAQRFAGMPEDDRRRFLFGLMNVSLAPDAIAEKMIARGCDPDRVRAIAPYLKSGFDTAHKDAGKRVTEARGAWKAVTGENYGSEKAKTWKADAGDWKTEDATALHKLDTEVEAIAAQINDANRRLGAAEAEAKAVQTRENAAAQLREVAKQFGYHQDLVNRAEAQIVECRSALDKARAAAGHAPITPATKIRACPACGTALCEGLDGALAEYIAPSPVHHDPEVAGRLPELAKAVQTAEAVLARHVANRDAADDAAKQLKGVETAAEKAGTPEGAGPIRETIATLQASLDAAKARQRTLKAAHDAFEAADRKTKDARKHHADVLAWGAIADALAQDGIPNELLSTALGPINKRLAQAAADTEWMQVRIGADMAISANGRAYRMLSASEKFRVDVHIAEAISHLSGLRLLCIDAFDILVGPARSQFLGWLDLLAEEGDIECAIVCGTLKEPPAQLPPTFQAVRIVDGIVEAQKSAQEEAVPA